ncbi:MAG: sigma-70 family RNA polymerase sigma factor [Patescibacteria group bacterium]|nr:sigma-70 family RNA polymerase sigma factor [Patescibacteria group bacterium]MDE2589153.1 sigma-70 family RNA polymerase sigma factor [Patescibacteria group bacterium]
MANPEIGNQYLRSNVERGQRVIARHVQSASEQSLLHEFQIDSVSAIGSALARRQTAFHIKEATGVGKTAIGLELAQVLSQELAFDDETHTGKHGVTIFVSPTVDILHQTYRAAARFAPNVSITNYYGDEKNVTGDIVNTTYDSLPKALEALRAQARDVRLAIFDEMHMGLGDVRHLAYRDIPNAIMVGLSATPDTETLDRLIRDNRVHPDDEQDRWVGMFNNRVHELDISEGIERGILSPLRIWTATTNVDASNVSVVSTGEYKQSELESVINQRARSLLAVAMIAGEDAVQEHFGVTVGEEANIQEVHQAIAGKKTLIFAGSIDHANSIISLLREVGVGAVPYYGGKDMTRSQREQSRNAFQTGNVNIMVGVRLLGVGLDLPEAEVGIFTVPRRSANDVEQELGRILRQAPGKEEAIAVQLVDRFARGKAPILIPQILDATVIRQNVERLQRATQRTTRPGVPREAREKPVITFSGMDLDAIVRMVAQEQRVKDRLLGARNITEITAILDNLQSEIMTAYPQEPIESQYRELANLLPWHMPFSVNAIALAAARSTNPLEAQLGANAVALLNIKTILGSADAFTEFDQEDLVQQGMVAVLEKAHDYNPATGMSIQITNTVKSEISRYIATNEFMEVLTWVKTGQYKLIRSSVDAFLAEYPTATEDTINAFVYECGTNPELAGVTGSSLKQYVVAKKAVEDWDENRYTDQQEVLAAIGEIDAVAKILDDRGILTAREALAIRLFFGVGEEQDRYTLQEITRMMGISPERVRQIRERALRKIRHPQVSREIR